MNILRAMFVANDGVYHIDVIDHAGEFWLVPEWLDNPAEGWSKPARIIRLNSVPHKKTLGGSLGDFHILSVVPKAALFGPYPYTGPLPVEMVEAPDIRVVRQIH